MSSNNQAKAREILARSPWCSQQDAMKAWDEAVALLNAPPETWTGEGLPPAGTVCEFQFLEETRHQFKAELLHGHKVTVIAHYAGVTGRMVAAFTFDYEDGNARDVESATEAHFRPIRTPEQIAEQELREALEELAPHIAGYMGRDDPMGVDVGLAAYLLDQGYRKQPSP